jgi:DNA-binding NtrC family response regulator
VVEDSWHIGLGLKNLLEAWEVSVAGPVATAADAERLISEQVPDVALVDLSLRGGEWAYNLIDRLHEKAVRVIVTTGYSHVQATPGTVAAILRKPFSEEQLLAALKPSVPIMRLRTRQDCHMHSTAQGADVAELIAGTRYVVNWSRSHVRRLCASVARAEDAISRCRVLIEEHALLDSIPDHVPVSLEFSL